MEPVNYLESVEHNLWISILRLRMEPVRIGVCYGNTSPNFYPQAPHGACRTNFSASQSIISISILRLRMEPVSMLLRVFYCLSNFYPQAPHGACQRILTSPTQMVIFLSSGSAWSLSIQYVAFSDSLYISILRLRMEPVAFQE